MGITTYWLRHTTLRWVERNFGHAVAKACAGHAISHANDVTTLYTRADIEEVATALATMTDEPHPLATHPGLHSHRTVHIPFDPMQNGQW
ncbi:hypothetical protein ACIRRA_38620 [Nocardia sp. NPDC101769]|uniref:hypothetical protein n=1 Tax=Nocardia sp. NPDC101769 TaxID=3364333 RepID=UPI003820D877